MTTGVIPMHFYGSNLTLYNDTEKDGLVMKTMLNIEK